METQTHTTVLGQPILVSTTTVNNNRGFLGGKVSVPLLMTTTAFGLWGKH